MKGVKIFFSTLTLRTGTKTRGIRGFKIVKGNVVDATGSLTQIPSTSCCTHLPSSYACKALPYSEIPGKSPPSLQVACSQPTMDGCDGTQNSSPPAPTFSWDQAEVTLSSVPLALSSFFPCAILLCSNPDGPHLRAALGYITCAMPDSASRKPDLSLGDG